MQWTWPGDLMPAPPFNPWQQRQQAQLPGGLRPYSVDMPGDRPWEQPWGPHGGWQSRSADIRGPQFQQTGAPTINEVPFALRQIGGDGGQGGGGDLGVGASESGHDFGGARGPGEGARGQPGLARDVADALFGLVGGTIAGPGFGIATALARTALDPSYNPVDPYGIFGGGGLFGGGEIGSGAAATGGTSGTAQGESGVAKGLATGTDPSGLGSASGGIGGLGGGGFSGADLGNAGSEGFGGFGGADVGEGRGIYAGGGVVRGRGGIDSQRARLTPGEGVLTPQALRALGPHTLYMLNSMFPGRR